MCPRTPSSEFAGFLKQMMGDGWALAHGRHIQGSAEQIPAFERATSLTVKPHALTKKKTLCATREVGGGGGSVTSLPPHPAVSSRDALAWQAHFRKY